MFAIRAERDFVNEEDFMKAVRKASAPRSPPLSRADPLLHVRSEQACCRLKLAPRRRTKLTCSNRRAPRADAQVAENKKLEGTLAYSKV